MPELDPDDAIGYEEFLAQLPERSQQFLRDSEHVFGVCSNCELSSLLDQLLFVIEDEGQNYLAHIMCPICKSQTGLYHFPKPDGK